MVDEEQFVEIIWKSLTPALELQSDIKKRCMDFVFWWKVAKKGIPTSKITFYEAWDFQSEITTKAKEDEAMAGTASNYVLYYVFCICKTYAHSNTLYLIVVCLRIIITARVEAYKLRGGAWKEDAPLPKAEAEKDRFDIHGNMIVSPPPAPKEGFGNSPGNGNVPRRRVHPKGRTLILPAIKRKKREIKVKEVKVIPSDEVESKSPKKEAPRSETMVSHILS